MPGVLLMNFVYLGKSTPGRIRTCGPRFRNLDSKNCNTLGNNELALEDLRMYKDLYKVAEAWPRLPQNIRQAILLLVAGNL